MGSEAKKRVFSGIQPSGDGRSPRGVVLGVVVDVRTVAVLWSLAPEKSGLHRRAQA